MSIKDLVPRIGRGRMPARRTEEDGLLAFQREVNRLFDDFFRGSGLRRFWEPRDTALAAYSPRVNVSETEKEVTVTAELPGMDEKDVNVELGDDALTISGEKKEEAEDEGRNWYRREYSCGSFRRSIPLPAGIDPDKARARFKKGVLTVSMPKRPEAVAARKTITIETE